MPYELVSPLPILTDPQSAADVATYLSSYTGRFFEPLAAMAGPDRFEATDLVAVSCLSVNVPADTAGWLLVGEGGDRCGELLAAMKVPVDATLRDHDLARNEAATALWDLLMSHDNLGATTVSKLLAAKRPRLVPIYDSYVAGALLPRDSGRRWQWWAPWRDLLLGSGADAIDDALRHIRHEVSGARPELPIDVVTDLRLMDIVIWMAEDRRRSAPIRATD
jgi:hypothetical protein